MKGKLKTDGNAEANVNSKKKVKKIKKHSEDGNGDESEEEEEEEEEDDVHANVKFGSSISLVTVDIAVESTVESTNDQEESDADADANKYINTVLAVGATGDSTRYYEQGAVYVYHIQTAVIHEIRDVVKLIPQGLYTNAHFGSKVALSVTAAGDVMAAVSTLDDNNNGMLIVYVPS